MSRSVAMRGMRAWAVALLLTAALALASCRNFFFAVNTFAPGAPGTVAVSLSLRDTPPQGVTILSAAVTISGAVLQPGNVSLLDAPVRVQLKKLETEIAFLGRVSAPATLFQGLNITLASPELTILNDSGAGAADCASGALCQVRPALNPASVFVPLALVVDSSTQVALLLDLDLHRSLQSDLSIQPKLSLSVTLAFSGNRPVEEVNDFLGQVSALGASRFTVTNEASGLSLVIGVDAGTAFAGFEQSGLSNTFTSLRVGHIVAVDMDLQADGTLSGREVTLEGSPNDREIEGAIVSVDVTDRRFGLIVLDEVPDAAGISTGEFVQVAIQPGAVFEIDNDGLRVPSGFSFGGPSDLLVGQDVLVLVRSLATSPSGTSVGTNRVRLRMAQITAQVGSKSANSFTLAGLPGLWSGAGITAIPVQPSLETDFENAGGVADLNAGGRVSVRGLLFGPTSTPSLLARKVRKL